MATNRDLEAEQAYIVRAYDRLEAMRAAAIELMSSVLAQGKGLTHQAREERDVIVRTSLHRLDQLDIGDEALCFGRIDHRAGDGDANAEGNGDGRGDGDGEGRAGETFYIGRLAVSAEDMEPLVVDWRAPVAEPFYRATGRHPMGLRRRRHFSTEGRRLVGIEDELFAADGGPGEEGDESLALVGTGALLAALERSRSGRMRDIVATVQREQDEIIRAPLPGVLVVQGGPGTGKTAVALHRAAYLLYTHRFPLERQGVLVVGPNPVFLRYIEQVLPSLGEAGVALTTIGGLVAEVRARASEPAAVAGLKGDARMAKFLARAVRDRQRPLRQALTVPFGPYLLDLGADESAAVVATARRRSAPHNTRRKFVESQVLGRLYDKYLVALDRARRTGLAATEEAPVERDSFERDVRRRPEVGEALDRMWPRLLPQELVHDLYGAAPLITLAGERLLSAEEQALLERPRSDSLGDIPWTPADLPLIDEARVLLGPARSGSPSSGSSEEPRSYGHIVVDEAQDLSPMQLRTLSRRSISGSMTVVGDIAQATGPRAPRSWDDVTRHLPRRRPARLVELTVNYRTPAEVMELAGAMLRAAAPEVRQPTSVRRTDEVPAIDPVAGDRILAEVAERAARESADLPEGSVAVIATASMIDELSSALTGAGLPFGEASLQGLESPITLVAVEDVKGLEFDSVIVVEPALIVAHAPQGLRSLYVALTRPTRRLSVVHSLPLPEALATALV